LEIAKRASAVGVDEVKLIYPNVRGYGVKMWPAFQFAVKAVLGFIPGSVRVRYTPSLVGECELKRRGFLSLFLPEFSLRACCADLNDRGMYFRTEEDFGSAVMSIMKRGQSIRTGDLPCTPELSGCPISLSEGVASNWHAGSQVV
jgi:hypothetical protein